MSADAVMTAGLARVEVRSVKRLSAAERSQLRGLLMRCFPGLDFDDYAARHPDEVVLVLEGRRLVSHLAIVHRIVRVGGAPVAVGGVGGVATDPDVAGRGLAGLALSRCAAHLRADVRRPYGLLRCERALIPYYERHGWRRVHARLFWREGGRRLAAAGDVPMVLACAGERWPAGDVDLRGPPW